MSVSPVVRRIAPQCGASVELQAGDTLVVIDPSGEQVADLFAFSRSDYGETISSGRSLDYAETLFLTTGNVLYSNRSRPMFEIVEDSVGQHDFLLTPCSQQTFEIIYGARDPHPSCFQNLSRAFAPYGIDPDTIGTTFNIFMNVEIASDGRFAVRPPRSRAGDTISLLAKMDLIVGLTACSAEMSNNYAFKPIDFYVREGNKGRARPTLMPSS